MTLNTFKNVDEAKILCKINTLFIKNISLFLNDIFPFVLDDITIFNTRRNQMNSLMKY